MTAGGIYQIRNRENGKSYVGSAVDFKKRWKTHQRQLSANKHFSKPLQASWNKYGAHAFDFLHLLICARQHLLMYEQIAIDAIAPAFNSCKVAGSTLGYKYSQEALARLSAAHSRENLSRQTRARMSLSQSKRRHSEQTKEKISRIVRGRKLSAEVCARRSKRMLGHAISDETKRKISAALKGRKLSSERVAQIAANSSGRKHSQETKAKIASAKIGNRHCVGRILSEETRAKQSAGIRAAIAKRKSGVRG